MTTDYVPGHQATPRLRVWFAKAIWWALPGRVQGWLCGCPVCRGTET